MIQTKTIKTITALLLLSLVVFKSYSQADATIKKFWIEVKFRREQKVMSAGLNSWLYQVAQGISGNSYTRALERLENIDKDMQLQDLIFLQAYCNNFGSKESLRFTLANLCGSYTLANPVSNYIFNKYSTDKRALSIIRQRNTDDSINQVKNNELKSTEHIDSSTEAIHTANTIEKMPAFNGDLSSFLAKNLKYPERAKGSGIEGRVVVKFTVTKTGEVVNCAIKRKLESSLDSEAVRVVQLTTGKWFPGLINGMPVDVYYEIPITFTQD